MLELMHDIVASDNVTYAACDLQSFVNLVYFLLFLRVCVIFQHYFLHDIFMLYDHTTKHSFCLHVRIKVTVKGIPFQFKLNFQMFLFGSIRTQDAQCATDKKNTRKTNNSIIYFDVKNDLSDCVLISCLCSLHVSFFLFHFCSLSLSLFSSSFSCCQCRPSKWHRCRHSNWF